VRVKNEPDCDLSTVQLKRTNEQHPQTKLESVIPPQCGALMTPQPSAHSHRPIPVLLPASSWRAGFLAMPARSHCPPSPTQSLPLKPTPPSRSKNTLAVVAWRTVRRQSSTDRMRPAAQPPLPPQRPRERAMPIIMLMQPMRARPPYPLRAATRPAAPRQSSPHETATHTHGSCGKAAAATKACACRHPHVAL